jgi:hypothetical protein
MLFFDGVFGLLLFGVWLFCIIDVITTPDGEARNLPKLLWLLIVVLLVDIGSLAWLIAGRNWNRRPGSPRASAQRRPPAPTRAIHPDDDEEFLAGLRARAEEQRRRARESQRDADEPPAAPPTP